MEFLRSFLRRYFEEELVVESQNVGCFLGLSRKKNELCCNPARFSVYSLCIALPYSDSTSYAGYQLFPQNQLFWSCSVKTSLNVTRDLYRTSFNNALVLKRCKHRWHCSLEFFLRNIVIFNQSNHLLYIVKPLCNLVLHGTK